MKKFFSLFFFLFASALFANEHNLTDIIGKDISLKFYDHAIAGQVKDFVIFGHKDDATNISELAMKRNGQLTRANFGKRNGIFGGVVSEVINGNNITTEIQLLSVDTNAKKLTFKINNQTVEVSITADDFRNNHFVNPHYRVRFQSGESFDYKIISGEACYNFSVHLAMMILSSYN